jgi:DNA-directed RNA polymerase specialized sigma24 family protein
MEQLRPLGLIDSEGKPVAAHLDLVLTRLVAKLRSHFPALQDDVTIVEVMEDAARKLARREKRAGPIEKLHGFAWRTVQRTAISRMRLGSLRVIRKTLDADVSKALLTATPATFGTPEEIERSVLMGQVRAKLSDEEWELILWKLDGKSTQEIARLQGRSVSAVDTMYSRLKDRLRGTLG